ncbi:MAG: tetratricopeptide repeat protein, partial [Myxococcota bacterium]|nr:tetratricopeptide repeat protein [Myxococcota bacterium]
MNANLERLRERFEADPGDALAFEALEEHHFVCGEWSALVRLYGRRLEADALAPERAAPARARLLLRLGQVLEERCQDVEGAIARYQEAVRLDPRLRAGFQALRRLYVDQEKWDVALQVAEVEAELPMPAAERAAFLAEMGRIWIDRLGDAEQARVQFTRALEVDPRHPEALRGAADLHQREGRPAEAAALLERALGGVEGPARARVHVRLARLLDGPLAEPDRAAEHYRRALTDDPRSLPALEALAERARVDGRWELFEELSERRFNLTSGAVRRLAIAHDVGHAHLERRAEGSARHWFQRALELFPDDPVVHLALADVERLADDADAVAAHLRRATELADDAAPVDLLVESARLAGEDSDLRVSQLRRAHERRPDDPQLLEELARGLSEAGRDEELVEVLEQRAALAPHGEARAAALLELGRAYEERLGDESGALDAFRRAAEEDRSAPEVAEPLARLLRKREDWEGLRDHLERAVAASAGHPERAVAHQCTLGELLIERWDDLDSARTWFERAVALDAGATRARQGLERIALALGDDEAILDAFEREAAVTTDRARLAFLVWELARIFEEREDPARALSWIERLAEAVPEDRRALEAAARLQESLGRRDALCATLARLEVLLDGEERAAVRKRRARALADLGRHDEAAEAWRRALEGAPEDVEALCGLDDALAGSEAWSEL